MTSLQSRLSRFMTIHKVLNLGYIDLGGMSQSCALWFAHHPDTLNLYLLSSLSTKHGHALQKGGQVSFTINEDDQHWKEIQGIQGRGKIKIMEDPDMAWEIYSTKYPFVKHQFKQLSEALEKTKLWVIVPTWLRLIDNTLGFGHKEEIEFSKN